MREKGELIKKGSLGAQGDIEFWDDGTSTPRSANSTPDSTNGSDADANQGRLTEPPASRNGDQPASEQSSHKP